MNSAEAQNRNLVIGTYTDKGTSEGIYVYDFNARSGKAVYKNKATGVDNPSYLTISDNGKFVYTVNEGEKGGVSAFSFDKHTGALKLLNRKSSHGQYPCYISTTKEGDIVFAGNYGSGNFSVFPVLEDGSLGENMETVQHSGNSVNKERQEGPHVHSTVLSPDEKYLFVSDLGIDKIQAYQVRKENKPQVVVPADPAFAETIKGSGPRHLDFHPNGKFAYSIQELNGNVTVFSYEDGTLNKVQDISMLAQDFKGQTGAADIHVSPDGKFLYTSNRGDANDIAIFAIDERTGRLTLKGRAPAMGVAPRNFVIDPSGEYLLVANQNSDSVVIFKRNKKTGLLKDTGERINVGAPVCLKFD